MFIAIDIGNTDVTLGFYEDEKLLYVSRFFSSRLRTSDEYASELSNILRLYNLKPGDIEAVAMSSVVPVLTDSISNAVRTVIKKNPLTVGEAHNGKLKVNVIPVGEIGADLICATVGAIKKYPTGCIIADLGTAIKLIAVSDDGYFLGCTISPGAKISLDALSKKTSLLPSITLSKPEHTVGTSTVECMQSGIVFGTAAMLDGMVERIIAETGMRSPTLVATGGYAGAIVPSCTHSFIIDDSLVLDGVREVYKESLDE